LGSGKDVDDIKSHVFFKDMSWDKMMKKEIEVSYKPKVKGKEDTGCFDEQFTKEVVADSLDQGSAHLDPNQQNAFGGFTFQQSESKLNG
jgi:hypothetical protein